MNNIFPMVSSIDKDPVSIAMNPNPATIDDTTIGSTTPSIVFTIFSIIIGVLSRLYLFIVCMAKSIPIPAIIEITPTSSELKEIPANPDMPIIHTSPIPTHTKGIIPYLIDLNVRITHSKTPIMPNVDIFDISGKIMSVSSLFIAMSPPGSTVNVVFEIISFTSSYTWILSTPFITLSRINIYPRLSETSSRFLSSSFGKYISSSLRSKEEPSIP